MLLRIGGLCRGHSNIPSRLFLVSLRPRGGRSDAKWLAGSWPGQRSTSPGWRRGRAPASRGPGWPGLVRRLGGDDAGGALPTDFDPLAEDVLADPYPAYEALHDGPAAPLQRRVGALADQPLRRCPRGRQGARAALIGGERRADPLAPADDADDGPARSHPPAKAGRARLHPRDARAPPPRGRAAGPRGGRRDAGAAASATPSPPSRRRFRCW